MLMISPFIVLIFVSFQLLGEFQDGMWHSGLLTKVVRDSYFMWLATKSFIESQKNQDKKNVKGGPPELPSILQRWLVLDGNLHPSWTEDVKTLLDDERKLSLGNGEGVLLRGKVIIHILFMFDF